MDDAAPTPPDPEIPGGAAAPPPGEAPADAGRRAFVQSAAVLASALLFSRNLSPAEARNDGEITARVLAEAEKLSGLAFTEDERAMMTGPLSHARENYERIRALRLPNELAPALQFRVAADPPREAATSMAGTPAPGPARTPRPASDDALAFLTIAELAPLLESGAVKAAELTRLYLDRLQRLGPKLNCVISLRAKEAIEEARQADEEIAAGRYRGPLHGIPWGAKDLLATRDAPTTWGAAPFEHQQMDYDAAVVERLREAGAILVAKLSLGELAQGDVWYRGRTLNPWDTRRGSSGSSAGPAAATAAALVGFSIGSETLGSIVMPSTVCGVSGLRPTFGRVSRHGAMNLSFSMDKLGPMCRSAEDCAYVFAAIHGADPRDPSSRDARFAWPPARDAVAGLRAGVLHGDFEALQAAEDAELNRRALQAIEDLGVTLIPKTLPEFPSDALRMILMVEAAAMFDELTLTQGDDRLSQQHPLAWPNSFRTARMVPAVEYLKAQQARALLMQHMEDMMADIDVLVTPSTTGASMTVTNLTGHPAVVVPSGFVRGTPRSITFHGRLFGDDRALALARAYQGITEWHRQHPVIA